MSWPWNIIAGSLSNAGDFLDPTEDFAPAQQGVKDAITLQRQAYEEGVQRMAPYEKTGRKQLNRLPGLAAAMRDYELPGQPSPYEVMQGPGITQYDPGRAPGYASWKADFQPHQWQPTQGPGLQQFQVGQADPSLSQAYDVNLGQGMGQYGVRGADPGGMYDVRGVDPGGTYQRGEFDFQADPGYQFRKEAGLEALDRAQAARGGRDSGRSFKEESEFLQGLASQEYGAAHQRHMGEEAAKQMAFESGAGRGLQAYGLEEPMRRGAFESAAGRGLQAYGLEEPLAAQAFESAAQRDLQRDVTGQQLGLQAHEGAAGRGTDIWSTGQQLGLQGLSDYQGQELDRWSTGQQLGLAGHQAYQDPMMQLQQMAQAENQFEGNLGLQSYLGEQGLRRGAHQDFMGNQLDMYRTQAPMHMASYQMAREDPWMQYTAGYGQEQDYYNKLANLAGSGQNAAAGMGATGQQYAQQAGLGHQQLGMLGMARSQAPWNTFMDVLGAAGNFAPYLGG